MAGIQQWFSILCRTNGNGRAEAGVKQVFNVLGQALIGFKGSWVDVLPWAVYTFNSLPSIVSTHSPHKIVFGREPVGLGDAMPLHGSIQNPLGEKWFQELLDRRKAIAKRITEVHQKLHAKYLAKVKSFSYEIGDRVWVKNPL